jgi:voltage-gated potassium channel
MVSRRADAASVPHSSRAWLYAVLEEGHAETPLGRLVETLLILLIITNVVAAALETVPSINAVFGFYFSTLERWSIFAYTIEYGLRVWCALEDPRLAQMGPVRGRVSFMARPFMVIDFLAFAPSYLGFFMAFDLRVLRIFRLFRLLKLARYSQALPALLGVLYAERAALFASLILLLSTVCAGAELMHFAEGAAQPKTLGTIPGAMYWAITTLTTVGYGDVTPSTPLGKFIAAVFMVLGLALFALPIGIIANGFVTGLNRRRFAVTWSVIKRQPLLDGLAADALNDVMDTVNATVLREHAHLVEAGAPANGLFLVVSGEGRVESGADGVAIGAGAVVGRAALHLGGTHPHTVTALTEMRVIELPADELRRLVRKYPPFGTRILAEDEAGPGPDERDLIAQLQAENAELRAAVVRLTLAQGSAR